MFRTLKYFPNGKEPEYTFFTDFDIASHFNGGIEDTYKRVIKEWKARCIQNVQNVDRSKYLS